MAQRVLVIDDEAHIRELVRLYLQREGFEIDEAEDGEAGLTAAGGRTYDLIVLDVLLPRRDGWQVCREIRARSRVPIIMLTARDDESDVVVGLELGADDYLTKPFGPRELVARERALLRRSREPEPAPDAERLQFPDFTLDLAARELVVRGTPVACPAKEFDLLWLLASNPRRVFSRDQLLEAVWGTAEFIEPRTVDVHVHRLRERVEPEPVRPRYLITVWGIGYRFEPGGRAEAQGG
jgi:two-component system response regulator ResD